MQDLASTLAELAREQATHRLRLGGPTEQDVARCIELGSAETPPTDLVTAIHAETEGNPLFVGEVARLLAAEASGRARRERPLDGGPFRAYAR